MASLTSQSKSWRFRGYSKDKQNDEPAPQSSGPKEVSQSPTVLPGRSDGDVESSSPNYLKAATAQPEKIALYCDLLEPDQIFNSDPGIMSPPPFQHPRRQPNMISYCAFPFISRADVFYTPSQDIQFLDSEGCFELPAARLLDQFFHQYFTNVHPMLPMLSEHDLSEARSGPNPLQSKMMSLLLVQAMLFAACSCQSIILQKVQEASKIQTAQAALLLTYWTPPFKADSRPNTMWLMAAIENAKDCQANFHSDVSNPSSLSVGEQSSLRRLWWCCIIRDRILPLGLRRCIHITRAHFDFEKNMSLGSTELQAEIQRSKTYCDDTKKSLSTIIDQVVKLSVILTDILLLAFPISSTEQSEDAPAQISKCKQALADWYVNGSSYGMVGNTLMADRSVFLHNNLMHTYYHWATIVMCHVDMRDIETRQLGLHLKTDASDACRLAEVSMIGIVESLSRLNQSGLTRCLPISIVAYAAFPLAIHVFDAASSETLNTDCSGDNERNMLLQKRLGTLIKTMRILREQYDGVDQVVKTIRHIVEYVSSYTPQRINGSTAKSQDLFGKFELALRVSLAIDWILSSGRSSDDKDFALYLRTLFLETSRRSPPPYVFEESVKQPEHKPGSIAVDTDNLTWEQEEFEALIAPFSLVDMDTIDPDTLDLPFDIDSLNDVLEM
ncbi:hypothetical protein F66182_1013 [Fusarium sp. NRRL 66182]|nr:hypothetical protein F66182_1013 [Fusarium sp. NRRL 66182]